MARKEGSYVDEVLGKTMTTFTSSLTAASASSPARRPFGRVFRCALTPPLLCLTLLAALATGAVAQTLTVSLSVSPSTVDEGDAVTITATLSEQNGFPNDKFVNLRTVVMGTTAEPQDFDNPVSNSITIPEGMTTGSVQVQTHADMDTDNETFIVAIRGGGVLDDGYERGSPDRVTITIRDTGTLMGDPEARFSPTEDSVTEAVGTVDVFVNLFPPPTSNLTVNYSVGGTATSGSDYTIAGSGSVSVSSGVSSVAIPVAIVDNALDESDETVVLTLTSGTGYTVNSGASVYTLTIQDDDGSDPPPPPEEVTVNLSAPQTQVAEGHPATITATLSYALPNLLEILLRVIEGGTVEPTDYGGVPTIRIPAGQTSGSAQIRTIADTVDEEPESTDEHELLVIGMVIGSSTNDILFNLVPGNNPTVSIGICDIDLDGSCRGLIGQGPPPPPTTGPTTPGTPTTPRPVTPSVNLGTQPSAFPEGRTATYTVVLSTRPTASVTITPTSADPAAVTVAPATLTFTPTTWETPQRITVTGVADADAMRERVTITHTATSTDARYRGLTIGTMTITVTDTTGPVFVSTAFAFTMAANQVGPTTVQTSGGQVAVVQATGVGITYSLAGGGQGRFAVAPVSGVVTTVGAATPPGTYALTVQATDARGRTATAPVVIEVVSVVGQRLTRVRRTVLPEAARLATGSAFAAVSNRLGAARTATRLRVAGYDLTEASAPPATARAQDRATDATPQTGPRAPATLDLSQVLAGSTFTLPLAATGEENGGLRPVLWGTVDWNALTGSGTAPDWDGEMLHAQLGADLQVTEHLLAGLALSHDRGTFDWTDASATTGTLSSHLTSLLPYLGWTLHDRVALWAAASLGRGEVSLEDTEAGTFDSPATAWSTGVGVRGALLPAGPTALALKAEAWLAQWTAAATGPMAALDTDVQRLRLALEGQRAWRWADGAALTPALALGVRHDGGEGETGTGLELGGGVQWHDPGRGLTLRARARTLLGRGEYRQWGAGGVIRLDPGADGRGLTLSLAPTWGAAASGGVARLWEEGLTGRPAVGRGPAPQLTAAVGYGLAAPGTPGTVTPYAGLALAGGQAQTWRTGLRLAVNTGLDAHLETTRREQPGTPPVHGVTLQARLRF